MTEATTTEVYFNCADADHLLMDRRGIAVNNLTEAFAHAQRLVRAMLAKPNSEDWRLWQLHVTDALGEEIFTLPFASLLGKPH